MLTQLNYMDDKNEIRGEINSAFFVKTLATKSAEPLSQQDNSFKSLIRTVK